MPAPPRAPAAHSSSVTGRHHVIDDPCLALPNLDNDHVDDAMMVLSHISPLKMRRLLAPRSRSRGVQVQVMMIPSIGDACDCNEQVADMSMFETHMYHHPMEYEASSPRGSFKRLVLSSESKQFTESSVPQ